MAQLRYWLKSTWNSRFRHLSSIFAVFPSSFSPLPISLIVETPSPLPKTTNPKKKKKKKQTNKQTNKTKQKTKQNQSNNTRQNIKPKCALVLRSTNTSHSDAEINKPTANPSHSGAEIDKPKLKELLRCQDRDFWIWVFALMPRYYECLGLGCCSEAKI